MNTLVLMNKHSWIFVTQSEVITNQSLVFRAIDNVVPVKVETQGQILSLPEKLGRDSSLGTAP